MKTPRFEIGLEFKRYSRKHPQPETIVDIYTTTNQAGDVVRIEYVTEHDFCGQTVRDVTVSDTTIARSIEPE